MSPFVLLSLAVLSVILPGAYCQNACPDGFTQHGASCYIFSILRVSWIQAWKFCELYGANLAAVETEQEQLFLEKYFKATWTRANQTDGIWLGGTDLLVENEWTWAKTLDPIEYSRWAPNEPNHLDHTGAGEDCLQISPGKNFLWNDISCSLKLNFVCEKQLIGPGNPVG